MDKRLPLYMADIVTGEDKMLSLSLTKQPASGQMGKVLSNDQDGTKIFFPILPANKPIYRKNETYGEHYVLFLPDVIRDIMRDANKRNIPFDLEHQGEPIDGIEWISSFQIDYKNKTFFNNYPNLTDGSWVGIVNLVNPRLRGEFCLQNIFGISISGIFSYHEIGLSEAIEIYKNFRI
jgi:hypothetical protein